MTNAQILKTDDGESLAYHRSEGSDLGGAGFIWCGGLKSNMKGGKALAMDSWARAGGHGFLRFDYFGHGESSGAFTDGTITRWHADTLAVIDRLTTGGQILVGSSMGGWQALLAALARPERIKGLILVAPAPDFTQKLMWPSFSVDIQKQIMEAGIYYEPSPYGDPMEITRLLIESGREHLIMDGPIDFRGPVHILQGMQDEPVPWQFARRLVDLITSEQVEFTLVKDGDHRLSNPADITRLLNSAERMIARLTEEKTL
ncbi:MAG: alpha/beta hydrolase [Robiginitomaculum sp.]